MIATTAADHAMIDAFYAIGERFVNPTFWPRPNTSSLASAVSPPTSREPSLMPNVAHHTLAARGLLLALVALIALAPSVNAVAYVRSLHSARSTGSGVADILDVRVLAASPASSRFKSR